MTTEPAFVSIQFDTRDLPRLAQAVAVARNIVSDRAATAKAGHPIITDDVLLHALYGELHKAARPRQESPMTTEQMDEKDRPEEPTRLESLHVARNILRERGLQQDFDNLTAMIEEGDEYLAATVEIKSVSAEDYVTMAEEPIEDRLRRAWLNGFKEGVDRSSFAATEATGRWDY